MRQLNTKLNRTSPWNIKKGSIGSYTSVWLFISSVIAENSDANIQWFGFFSLVALWLSLPPELIALQSVGTTEGKKGATTFCHAWLPKLMPWSRLYGQAWLVLALIPILGAGMSKYLQGRRRRSAYLDLQWTRGVCSVQGSLSQKKKKQQISILEVIWEQRSSILYQSVKAYHPKLLVHLVIRPQLNSVF